MTHTFKFQKCLNHKTKIERDTHSTQTVTVSAIKLTKKNKMVKTIKNMINIKDGNNEAFPAAWQ